MTVIEKAPERVVRSRSEAELMVASSDITFCDLNKDTVLIQVRIRNAGERRSRPTIMRLEAAPLGVFVPWGPLGTIPVPALEPGESRELRIEAERSHPAPLGEFGGVPPASVLTALDASPDEPSQQPTAGVATLLNLLRRQGTAGTGRKKTVAKGPSLPPDLWELFGHEQPHWAGNINVFVGDRAVERHLASALRIYSGRTNFAMFVVGGAGKSDAYAFDIVGLAQDWKAALYDMTRGTTLLVGDQDTPVQERQWTKAAGGMLMLLAVRPPLLCENGNVEVHVTSRSCLKRAVVEFDLDPTAQGTGCYAV